MSDMLNLPAPQNVWQESERTYVAQNDRRHECVGECLILPGAAVFLGGVPQVHARGTGHGEACGDKTPKAAELRSTSTEHLREIHDT